MKRAYLMEMTIFRDYVKQLMGVGFFVALFVSAGMGSIVAAPRDSHHDVLPHGHHGSGRLR